MNRCPISYEPCGNDRYSKKGLKQLSPRLAELHDFPYSAGEQQIEAALRMTHLSIQGVQPKLSARLNIKECCFELTNRNGHYILKPQHILYPEMPENEDCCMRLAKSCGIEVPLHGLMYCRDQSKTYFVKRFDRKGKVNRIPLEDFAQLTGRTRNTKYQSSMEDVVSVLNRCTFPVVEKAALLRRCLFNWLIGNEDMHLKNFSLIRRAEKIELAPAYDFLSSTLIFLSIGKPLEEIKETALPLNGRQFNLDRTLWTETFAQDLLNLNEKTVYKILMELQAAVPGWEQEIQNSFLSEEMQTRFIQLIQQRSERLFN